MAEGNSEKAGIIEFVVQALNVYGIVAASVYDTGKDIAECARDIAYYGLDEEKQLTEIIREYERRKDKLYYLIGRQSLNLKNRKEKEEISQYISEVRNYDETITRLKDWITKLQELKSVIREQKTLLRGWKGSKDMGEKVEPIEIKVADTTERKTTIKDAGKITAPTAMRRADPTGKETIKAVDAAIAEVVLLNQFGTPAAMVMFKKVATDLLDSDLGNKVLAVTELGKIGNNAAVPILLAAVNFRHPELISEIIKTLTALGDSRAIPLMYEEVTNPDYRVRSACLRGLFKLKDDEKEIPVLVNGLSDKHNEVRRTAATLLGWKGRDDVLPELTRRLKDEDAKVRRAVVLALTNIKNESSLLPLINTLKDENLLVREKALDAIRLISGKKMEFDVKATGADLTLAINNLRDRFQKKSTAKKEEVLAPAAKTVKEPSKAEGETIQIKFDKKALTKEKKVGLLDLSLENAIKGSAT